MILLTLAALLAQALGGPGAPSPEIVLQSGHGANISALAFSPDGKFLVSASEDATLRLWNPETGAEIRTLRGHSNIITSLALSSDSSLIASASLDHTLRVWNSATGESAAVLHGPQPTVYLLKFTPDSQSLITAETVPTGTILRIWDIKSGKQMRLIKREDAAVSHVFFVNATTMLVADESGEDDATGSLTSYDLRTGHLLQTRQEILCGVSDNGKWIAIDRSTVASRRAVIVDLARDKPFAALAGQVSRVMFSSNGEWLAYETSAGDAAIVRHTSGGEARTIHGRGAEFSMLALSPDGRCLATAGADFSIHLWDVETGKLAHAMAGQFTPTALAFSPDGRRIATNGGSTDLADALRIWSIEKKSLVSAPRFKRSITGLAYNKDGSYLAVTSSSLDIFDARTGASVSKFDCSSDSISSPTFSVNGRLIAANCGGTISVWSLASAAELFHFSAGSDANGPLLSFSSDGHYLAAAASTGITLYDIAARKALPAIPTSDPVTALTFNPSSDLLAYGLRLHTAANSDDRAMSTLFTFDLHTRRRVWSAALGRWVSAIQFEPDGRSMLVATGDDPHRAGSLVTVESANGKPIRKWVVRVPSSATVVISPNGEWLAAGWNSATHVWHLAR